MSVADASPRAILFDIDGTLLRSRGSGVASERRYLMMAWDSVITFQCKSISNILS